MIFQALLVVAIAALAAAGCDGWAIFFAAILILTMVGD